MRPTRQEVERLLIAIRRGQERAVGSGRPEAVLREEVQPVLSTLLRARGSRFVARDEARLTVPSEMEAHLLDAPLTTFGRADAVYNRFVIEFEPPGSLRPSVMHSANRHAVSQVQQYLRGLAQEASIPLERLAGCAFDGSWIVYVTWERAAWVVSRPRPVDASSLGALIESLDSLATGRGLTASNLDEDFGQASETARGVVGTLFGLISSGEASARGMSMFKQWEIDIGQASGQFSPVDLSEWRSLCSALGVPEHEGASKHVLFALQTYFALVAKVAALIILEGATATPLIPELMTSPDVLSGFRHLESGKLTLPARTANAVEPGIFSWYATETTSGLSEALAGMMKVTAEYSAEIVEITPLRARDVLKDLYQRLIPRSIRHRLGEYYTPDWLAERLVNQVVGAEQTSLDVGTRVLDPACGSGTFLVEVLSRMIGGALEGSPGQALQRITENVVGFDLSPLAVQAAKVNYLLAIAPLLRFAEAPVVLPVFLSDSVSLPRRGTLLEGDVFVLDTSEGEWRIPSALAEAHYLPAVGDLLREGLDSKQSSDWVARELTERLPIGGSGGDRVVAPVVTLYEKLQLLDEADRDGMWWYLLSNAFAPALQGRFDFVVGNPPWVSWETLPERYRRANDDLWIQYGLRGGLPPGRRQASSNVRLDLSMLFVAVCVDRYLAPDGRLGFLITSSVFRSELAGRGFRKRSLPSGLSYRFLHIDDMSSLSVFEGAANQTSVLVVSRRDRSSSMQIPVARWTGPDGGRLTVPTDVSLDEAGRRTVRRHLFAEPIDPADSASPLLTMPRAALEASRPLRRKSPYLDVIREGVNTRGANGVFFVEVLEREADQVRIRNLADEGRNAAVDSTTGWVESGSVRRLLRGSDVRRGAALPGGWILFFHDDSNVSSNIPPLEVKRRFPLAYDYVKHFETVLRGRRPFRNFDASGDGWLGLYSVTTAALRSNKVVVREIADGMIAAAVHDADVVPDHKLYVIPCTTRAEAELLAKVLNTRVVNYMIRAFALSTSITGSFLRYVGIRDLSGARSAADEDDVLPAALGLSRAEYRILDELAEDEP